MKPWPHGDPDIVVRDVLAADAYRNARATTSHPPERSFWSALWAWFVEHVLAPIFAPIGKALASASALGLGPLLVGVSCAVALGLIAFVVFRSVANLERRSRERGDRRGVTTPLGSPRDATVWRELAADAAARGDYGRAIAALFAAALALLDERAIVRFDASLTPGEYRRAVRRERADAAGDFDELARRFVLAAYANDRPDAAAFVEAERAFERFERAEPATVA